MSEKIIIKCPICSAILMVAKQPNFLTKSFTCPLCRTKSKIDQCIILDYGTKRPISDSDNSHELHHNAREKSSDDNRDSKPNAEQGERVVVRCICGKLLSFIYRDGGEKSFLTCPHCKARSRIDFLPRVLGKIEQKERGILVKIECLSCKATVNCRYESDLLERSYTCPSCGVRSKIEDSNILGYEDVLHIRKNDILHPYSDSENTENSTFGIHDSDPYARPGDKVILRCICGRPLPLIYREGIEDSFIECPHCKTKSKVGDLPSLFDIPKQNPVTEYIKIKCLSCGARLKVPNLPDIQEKNYRCPHCGATSKVGDSKILD